MCFDLDCATIEKKEAAESAGRKTMGKKLRLLFIGNSHTYYNDMPLMAAKKARAAGYDCEVTMIAHGGWFLAQHVAEPDVRFDILFGNYDYVILQEHAHPFGPEEKFFEAARKLNAWIREANSTPVIYMTWAMKEEEAVQPRMTKAHREIAEEIDNLSDDEVIALQAYLEQYNDIEQALEEVRQGNYTIYYDCDDMSDVAYQVVNESGLLDGVPETIKGYFDYEAYGRDIDIEGTFIQVDNNIIELY